MLIDISLDSCARSTFTADTEQSSVLRRLPRRPRPIHILLGLLQ